MNVSDLERSRAWYEAVTPLGVVAETSADQAFSSLGISHGRFKGLMMKDQTQAGGFPMIHLVEWESPKPFGTPYLSQANVGWYRIVPQVEDVDASRQAVIAQGSEPFFPTTDVDVTFHPDVPPGPYNVFAVHDPDGTTLEFADVQEGIPVTPIVVAHNTADVDRYISFYLETLGLDFLQGTQTGEVPNVYSPLGGTTVIDGAFFGMRGDTRVFFDWLEWRESRDFPTPYQAHNHLGVIRCALEVDDLDAAYATLERSRWARKRRIVLGPPEEWDYGADFGTRRVLNLADPEGVFFQLLQQPPSPLATLHPLGYDSFPSGKGGPGPKG